MQCNDDLGMPAEDVEAPTLVYVETTERPEELITGIVEVGLKLFRREDWQVPEAFDDIPP